MSDETTLGSFGNLLGNPLMMPVLSFKPPHRFTPKALPKIALLPITKAKGTDSEAHHASLSQLTQDALCRGTVNELQALYESGGFGMEDLPGAPTERVRILTLLLGMGGDLDVLRKALALMGRRCTTCIARPPCNEYFAPGHGPGRRTVASAAAARSVAAATTTKAAKATALKEQGVLETVFDRLVAPDGRWNHTPSGIYRRSMGCPLHGGPLCKFVRVSEASVCILGADSTPAASEVLDRYKSAACGFNDGCSQWVSIRAWRSKTWWSGAARWTELIVLCAVLRGVDLRLDDDTAQTSLLTLAEAVLDEALIRAPVVLDSCPPRRACPVADPSVRTRPRATRPPRHHVRVS